MNYYVFLWFLWGFTCFYDLKDSLIKSIDFCVLSQNIKDFLIKMIVYFQKCWTKLLFFLYSYTFCACFQNLKDSLIKSIDFLIMWWELYFFIGFLDVLCVFQNHKDSLIKSIVVWLFSRKYSLLMMLVFLCVFKTLRIP